MAALWWLSYKRRLGPPPFTVAAFRNEMAARMLESGFHNVVVNEFEVAGGLDGCWVSMAHFFAGGRLGDDYWEVIMCAGDSLRNVRAVAGDTRMIASWYWSP